MFVAILLLKAYQLRCQIPPHQVLKSSVLTCVEPSMGDWLMHTEMYVPWSTHSATSLGEKNVHSVYRM